MVYNIYKYKVVGETVTTKEREKKMISGTKRRTVFFFWGEGAGKWMGKKNKCYSW